MLVHLTLMGWIEILPTPTHTHTHTHDLHVHELKFTILHVLCPSTCCKKEGKKGHSRHLVLLWLDRVQKYRVAGTTTALQLPCTHLNQWKVCALLAQPTVVKINQQKVSSTIV